MWASYVILSIMCTPLESVTERIKSLSDFEDVSGCLIPSFKEPHKESLFINCFCRAEYAGGEPEEILQRCRNDAKKALLVVSEFMQSLDVETVLVSINKDSNHMPWRVYRAAIGKDELRASRIDGNVFARVLGEESQLSSLKDCIARTCS